MINSQTRKLENDIIKMIEDSQLPISIVYYLIKAIFLQIESIYLREVQNEGTSKIEEGVDEAQ